MKLPTAEEVRSLIDYCSKDDMGRMVSSAWNEPGVCRFIATHGPALADLLDAMDGGEWNLADEHLSEWESLDKSYGPDDEFTVRACELMRGARDIRLGRAAHAHAEMLQKRVAELEGVVREAAEQLDDAAEMQRRSGWVKDAEEAELQAKLCRAALKGAGDEK